MTQRKIATLFLLVAAFDSLVVHANEIIHPGCFNDTTAIENNLMRRSGRRSGEVFVLCPNTVFHIDEDAHYSDPTTDEMGPPIVPRHDNTTFRCGEDGASSNNCILQGGKKHVVFGNFFRIQGVPFQGLTFRNANLVSISATGKITGSHFSFQDCVWESNQAVLYGSNDMNPTFDDCIFQDNQYATSYTSSSALISTRANTIVRNSLFQRNGLNESGSSTISAVSYSLILSYGVLTVENSLMRENNATAITAGDVLHLINSTFEKTQFHKPLGTVYMAQGSTLGTNKGNTGNENLKGGLCNCIFRNEGNCEALSSFYKCDGSCFGSCVPFNVSDTCGAEETSVSLSDNDICANFVQGSQSDANVDDGEDDGEHVCASCKCTTCEGKLKNFGKGPTRGIAISIVALLACLPVICLMIRIFCGLVEFMDEEDEVQSAKWPLLLSGLSKLATRLYAGLYVGSAVGSLYECFPDAGLTTHCLADGYGWEAFVIGFSALAAGLLDWMTIMFVRFPPLASSMSGIRWEVINQRRVRCMESFVLGGLFMILAVVVTGGHIVGARDAVGLWLAILYGIILGVAALFTFFCLGPFLCCGFGICGIFTAQDDDLGSALSKIWTTYRTCIVDIPGIILTAINFSLPGLIAFGLDLLDEIIDLIIVGCVAATASALVKMSSSRRRHCRKEDEEKEGDKNANQDA